MGGHGHGGHGGHFRGGGFRGGGFVYPLYDFYPPDPGPDIIILSEQTIDATADAALSRNQQQRSPVHGEPRGYHGVHPHGRARPTPPHVNRNAQAQRSVYGPHGGRVHPPHGHAGARESNAALHGDTTGAVGNVSEFEPNFGLDLDYGQTGMQVFSGVNNSLDASGGGLDPFGLAQFGVDDEVVADELAAALEDFDMGGR